MFLTSNKVRCLTNEEPARNLDMYRQIEDYIQSKTKKVCKDMYPNYSLTNNQYYFQSGCNFETRVFCSVYFKAEPLS
jgi:hypothetical protein